MKYFTLLFLLIGSICVHAQDIEYTFELDSSLYSELIEPTIVSPSIPWDDFNADITSTFPVKIYNSSNTVLLLFDTGNLITTGDSYYTPGLDLFMGFAADPIDRGSEGKISESDVSFQVTGDPGAQILKVQWRNIGFYNDEYNFEDFGNYQVWFYEANDYIEVHFGENSNPSLDLLYLSGSLLARDYGDPTQLFQYTVGNESDPGFFNTTSPYDIDETGMLSSHPANGRVYRFIPGFVENIASSEELEGIKIYPSVTDRNVTVEGELTDRSTLMISDVSGKILETQILEGNSNLISLDKYANGYYLFSIESYGKVYKQKILKQ